jgi:ABC-type multidrug transport system fused ATPase/permease subunit
VQRFSKDLDQIDQQLPSSLGQFMSSALNIAGSLIAISTITPTFGVVMLPVFVLYYRITDYYRNVARELKRLESISRSPIFAHFGETLGGLPVIRSFMRQKVFLRTNEVKLDDNIASYYAMKAVDRWLSVRLELLGNTIVFFAALLAVLSASRAGTAGISLNNALQITSMLNWAVRNGAEAESLMNSVER